MTLATEDQSSLDLARRVLEAEASAIGRIAPDRAFERAVELLVKLEGSLVVSGLGKSGLIGQKLSATFASTGTPSHFLHPVEAMHGDLGRIRRGDAVLVLSYGGQTDEIVSLVELLVQDQVPVLAIAGQRGGDLARLADAVMSVGDVTEACPHNLAPTASTTAMLALGDALALAVSHGRRFSPTDFHRVHPAGGLGRQLRPVVEVMRFRTDGPNANLPLLKPALSVEQAYGEAETFARQSGLRRSGALLVVDDGGELRGIVTDGDLRTALIRHGPEVWAGPIERIMTAQPSVLDEQALVRDAVRLVREHRFDELPVVDGQGRPLGIIDVQDLAALKVIEG